MSEEIKSFTPKNQLEWRNWLEKNHKSEKAVWLIFFKKSSPNHNLSWSDAVDEALCFGWIDSVKKTVDKESYKQYFSKRKANSTWSKVNKTKVDELIASKKMKEAGLATIKVAKENGSWTTLDAIDDLIVPEDLKNALEKDVKSNSFFSDLSNSAKKILLYWVYTAKRAETREKRIKEIVENAMEGQKPKAFR